MTNGWGVGVVSPCGGGGGAARMWRGRARLQRTGPSSRRSITQTSPSLNSWPGHTHACAVLRVPCLVLSSTHAHIQTHSFCSPSKLCARASPSLSPHRRHVLPDQALFLAVCMPSLERLTLVQCGLAPSAVARLWQQRPCLVVISSASAAAYMGGGGGGGGVCGGEGLGGGGGAGDGGSGEGGVGGAGGGSKVMGYGLALAAPAGGGGGGGGGGGEGLLLEEVEAGAGA